VLAVHHKRLYDAPMPAKNPRITITLEPAFHATLQRLSSLTGDSQSKLVTGMLEGSQETLQRLIKVLEAADLAKGSIKGNVAQEIKQTQSRMELQLGLMLDDFDQSTQPLLVEVEAIKRRARKPKRVLARDGRVSASAAVEGSTPISNRGVRSTLKPGKVVS
jgi:hypothetical protein